MPIHKLTQAAVRVLGATQTLTDPASVVKELVDNALDANATSVSVEISTNTLDVIQVRDCGHGIAPEDRQAVARPHCTSKITHDEDVKTIGGLFLGFRGVALASIAEVSGSLTISSRVDGETVAAALKINRQGEVMAQSHVSHPVGTTIRVTDFFNSFAVRRQQSLKNAERCLKNIQHILRAYAFARPNVRFSLRVLGAKNDKRNWTYAPSLTGSLQDTACSIVGAACASQCVSSVIEAQGFTIRAFLPRLNPDVSKISGVGSYMSVDGRPVNANRNTFKQIGKLFREALKQISTTHDAIKDPFLYLDITCPPASYDPNVEPAKDDVLFENPDDVMDAMRQLLSAVYPYKAKHVPDTAQTLPAYDMHSGASTYIGDDSTMPPETPRSRHPGIRSSSTNDTECARVSNTRIDECNIATKPMLSSMYGQDEEDDINAFHSRSSLRHDENGVEELRRSEKDISLSNPWVFAAMHSPTKLQPQPVEAYNSPLPMSSPSKNTGSSSRNQRLFLDEQKPPYLLTPQASSPHSRAYGFRPVNSAIFQDRTMKNDFLRSSPPNCDASACSPLSVSADSEMNYPTLQQRTQEQIFGDTSPFASQAGKLAFATPLSALSEKAPMPLPGLHKYSQQSRPNPPYKPPLKGNQEREKVWFDHLENTDKYFRASRRRQKPQDSKGLVEQGEHLTTRDDRRILTSPRRNRDIREFVGIQERRNDSIPSMIERGNLQKRSSTEIISKHCNPELRNDTNVHSGHDSVSARRLAKGESVLGVHDHDRPPMTKRRKTSDRRALREVSGNNALPDRGKEVDVPVAMIVRTTSHRRKSNSRRLTRTKSSYLPLESTPTSQKTHDIVSKIVTSNLVIAQFAGMIDGTLSLSGYNEPGMSCFDAFDIVQNDASIEILGSDLREVLVTKVSDGEMIQDLCSLLRRALKNRNTIVLDEDVGEENQEMLI